MRARAWPAFVAALIARVRSGAFPKTPFRLPVIRVCLTMSSENLFIKYFVLGTIVFIASQS
jgi:hypothetical protein